MPYLLLYQQTKVGVVETHTYEREEFITADSDDEARAKAQEIWDVLKATDQFDNIKLIGLVVPSRRVDFSPKQTIKGES